MERYILHIEYVKWKRENEILEMKCSLLGFSEHEYAIITTIGIPGVDKLSITRQSEVYFIAHGRKRREKYWVGGGFKKQQNGKRYDYSP